MKFPGHLKSYLPSVYSALPENKWPFSPLVYRSSGCSQFPMINHQRHVSDSYSLEKADSIWSIRSEVVVARPCWEKAWAAHARANRAEAHPAITPAPGSGHSECRVAQYKKTEREPESKSPWPPHLKSKRRKNGQYKFLLWKKRIQNRKKFWFFFLPFSQTGSRN